MTFSRQGVDENTRPDEEAIKRSHRSRKVLFVNYCAHYSGHSWNSIRSFPADKRAWIAEHWMPRSWRAFRVVDGVPVTGEQRMEKSLSAIRSRRCQMGPKFPSEGKRSVQRGAPENSTEHGRSKMSKIAMGR